MKQKKNKKVKLLRAILTVIMLSMCLSISSGVSAQSKPQLQGLTSLSVNYSDSGAKIHKELLNQKGENVLYAEIAKPVVFIGFCVVAAFIPVLIILLWNRILALKKYKNIAYIDSVTGASTMEKFKRDAKGLFEKYGKEKYSLVYLDIKRFKYVNDAYGYKIGNELLKHIADCIAKDLYDYEIFAHFSADNFIILLKNTDETELAYTVNHIGRSIQEFSFAENAQYRLDIRFGIYVMKNTSEDIYKALDKANSARKTLREHIGYTYAFYDNEMHEKLVLENRVIDRMAEALKNDEFVVYFQPKVNLKTGKIAGAEALVRWKHPERGLLPPDMFIPLFERNGFIKEIDFYVYEKVCQTLQDMKTKDYQPYPISVNLSRLHMQSRGFINKLCNIAKSYEIPLKMLELELTETVILKDVEELQHIMTILQGHGFILSMDDFGTGYSSLNLLKSLNVDVLKLDKNFFDSDVITDREKTIIADIITMAHHLGMLVVSEGMETEEQRRFLLDISCDLAQGFLYAKPMPVDEYYRFVESHS